MPFPGISVILYFVIDIPGVDLDVFKTFGGTVARTRF